jgi:hypothetical protein
MKADAIVEVELLATANGGRNGPTPSDKFGCPLEIESKFYDCRFDLTESGPLRPGYSTVVPVAFLFPDDVIPLLSQGTRFNLWEGRTIGTGRVISISSA